MNCLYSLQQEHSFPRPGEMLGLVFPHQCFQHIPESWDEIWFVRHDIAYGGKHTTVRDFHISRKVFFRSIELAWIDMVRKKGIRVQVIDQGKKWYTTKACEYWNPVDVMLETEIHKHCPNAVQRETPAFLLTTAEARELFVAGKGHAAFYAAMRKRFDILMTRDGKPEGGKYRFDEENRLAIGAGVSLPDWEAEGKARQSVYVEEAAKQIKGGLGTWSGCVFPTTHQGAKTALKRFVEKRLKSFGPYEDAILDNEDFLFHSVLSAPINAGLLLPGDVIEAVLAHKGKVPMSSLEGFVAQVLGWREYMRALYVSHPKPPANRLKHTRSLGSRWYNGTTGLLPVDTAIQRVNKWAYLHHIERLMIVGNAMFLAEVKPLLVYKWFMEMFADSFDWVMVGNVYYMSQWASDAMTTKPYISSSAYVLRMSNYKRGPWCQVWDALYWNSVHRHSVLLRKNYRMAAQVAFWERKSDADKRDLRAIAKDFLEA
jgi:deoxyribodipyrimidine photolyase-related protein